MQPSAHEEHLGQSGESEEKGEEERGEEEADSLAEEGEEASRVAGYRAQIVGIYERSSSIACQP